MSQAVFKNISLLLVLSDVKFSFNSYRRMKLQDFQSSKCSYPAHIPFSIIWSEDDCVAMATENGVYITGGGRRKRILTFIAVFIFAALIDKTECGNLTNVVFGSKTDGLPAAFGDFNSDEYPDLFVINRNRKTIEILLGAESEPYLRTNKNLRCDFDLPVTSIVPGDFDGDALMDVLVTLEEGTDKNLVLILWGSASESLNCSDKKILFNVSGQPLAMDYNQDMIIDLFGLNSTNNERTFWVFQNKTVPRTDPIVVPMLKDENRQFGKLRIPHSHAFLDLNDDSAADLLITSEHMFEIWLWNKSENGSKFVYDTKHRIIIPSDSISHIGQSLLLDIELTGKMDHVLPVCFTKSCSNSTIFVYSDGKWHNLKTVFFDGSTTWGFVPPMKNELFLEAITLHGGDFNMDGYPDLLATLQHDNIRKSFLLENVECTNCHDFSRKFVVNWHALDPYNNNTRMGVFYDFLQDGVLDIIFVHDDPVLRVSAFKNSLDYDANFVKVMVITGLKEKHQPVIPGPLGGRKNRTYGTNLPGPKIEYKMTTQEGNSRAAVASQLPQSAYFCLHLPYTLFGLGRTPNFVDNLIVGVSGHSRTWPQIIPNSQMVVIPRPPENPQKWTARLFVTPSKLIVQSFIALLATCLFISLIIGVLYWKERREDNYEKFHYLY